MRLSIVVEDTLWTFALTLVLSAIVYGVIALLFGVGWFGIAIVGCVLALGGSITGDFAMRSLFGKPYELSSDTTMLVVFLVCWIAATVATPVISTSTELSNVSVLAIIFAATIALGAVRQRLGLET